MKVHLEFMATLRRSKNVPREFDLEVPENITVREVIKDYFTREELKMIQVIINGIRVRHDYQLKDSDTLFLTIPIGGG